MFGGGAPSAGEAYSAPQTLLIKYVIGENNTKQKETGKSSGKWRTKGLWETR